MKRMGGAQSKLGGLGEHFVRGREAATEIGKAWRALFKRTGGAQPKLEGLESIFKQDGGAQPKLEGLGEYFLKGWERHNRDWRTWRALFKRT